jgi:hypothetical protein
MTRPALRRRRRAGPAAALLGLALAACADRREAPPSRDGPAPAEAPAPGAAGAGQEEIDRLRALGYVDVVEAPEPDGPAARVHDRAAASPGLTYLTNAHGCSSQLVSLDGETLRRWHHEPCEVWHNSLLLPDGGVLAVHVDPTPRKDAELDRAARRLLRFEPDGSLRWSRALPVHHDVDVAPDGRLATLTFGWRRMPGVHPTVPVRDNAIAWLSASGELLEEASLADAMLAGPAPFSFAPVAPSSELGLTEIDLLHANSIEVADASPLAGQGPLYAPGNVLVCIRHQDVVAILDPAGRRLLWQWGRGELSGPHDATLLPSGNVLVFDNGLGRKWSRVVEVDPRRDAVVWEYRAVAPDSLYTETRGAAQRLANGNTLVTESGRGRILEVTPAGRLVWEFMNPTRSRKGKRVVIVRARRLPEPGPGEPFAEVD